MFCMAHAESTDINGDDSRPIQEIDFFLQRSASGIRMDEYGDSKYFRINESCFFDIELPAIVVKREYATLLGDLYALPM